MEPRPLNTKIVYVAHLPEYCPGLQQLVFLNDSAGTLVGGLVELSKLKKGREAKSILDVAHNVSHAVIK